MNEFLEDDLCLLVLTYTQAAAIIKIVYSAVGFVRSPVGMTAIQVSSRVGVLYYLLTSHNAIGKYLSHYLNPNNVY